jgi:DNA-binding XRE family transcriptional regulator
MEHGAIFNKVKELRELNAWTIAELARLSGLTPQTVTKIENGAKTRKNSQLKVSKALGKKYEDVFGTDER